MADHNKTKNSNIGENTNWDSPLKKSQNGASIQKPPKSLKPEKSNEK